MTTAQLFRFRSFGIIENFYRIVIIVFLITSIIAIFRVASDKATTICGHCICFRATCRVYLLRDVYACYRYRIAWSFQAGICPRAKADQLIPFADRERGILKIPLIASNVEFPSSPGIDLLPSGKYSRTPAACSARYILVSIYSHALPLRVVY